ncbi:Mss4p nuclear export [Orbilia ellipsospora]|uniref:Protein BCP1 n=1 Tax=Orbilia ellipsospora TaxID=2528407 RepID=A0AAV9XKP6_9PEZI
MATTQEEEDTPMATSEQSHQLKDTSKPSKPQDRTKSNSSKKKKRASKDSDSDDESDSDPSHINVDFEFFDPQPHDFHGIKQLLRQLFDADSQLLDLSALADLILEQKLVGSTVKVDGMEGDPYSFLSVINWAMHKENPAIKALSTYLLDRASNTPLSPLLTPLLSATPPENTNTAIILSERLLNMPADISPPSYKMLLEEIQLAIEDNEPYSFTNYLLISKVYTEIESKLPISDDETTTTTRPTKRNKLSTKKKKKASTQTFNFHPEDDFFISQVDKDEAAVVYSYKHEPPEAAADAKRAFQDFGILPKGRMILLSREAFEKAVETMQP